MVPINILATLLCGVEAVVLGILWYGPLFGKPWRKEMGVTDEQVAQMRSDKKMQQQMMKSAAIAFVFALITAQILSQVIGYVGIALNVTGLMAGVHAALLSWIGFAVPVLTGAVLWENKTWKWWWITVSYYLASWVIMGLILTLMP